MSAGYSYNSAWIDGYMHCRNALVQIQSAYMEKMKQNFNSSSSPEEKAKIDRELLTDFFNKTFEYLTKVPK